MNLKRWTRPINRWVGLHIGVPIGTAVIRGLRWTLRHSHQGEASFYTSIAEDRRFIIAFWHDDSLHLAIESHRLLRSGGLHIMTSPGRDGEIMARFLNRLGIRTTPGSTTHGGGRALLKMIHAMEPRDFAAMAVDGSRRCPRFHAQEGVLLLSRRTGLPVVPVAARVDRKWVIGNKDRIEVPRPFSRTTFYYGEPIVVPADTDKAGIERLREALEASLLRLKGLMD